MILYYGQNCSSKSEIHSYIQHVLDEVKRGPNLSDLSVVCMRVLFIFRLQHLADAPTAPCISSTPSNCRCKKTE